MPMYHHYRFAGPWPERRMDRTYCAYCGRQHREGLTSCEGCGAPVTAPGRIDALQTHLDTLETAMRAGMLSVDEARAWGKATIIRDGEPLPPPPHMVRR